MKYLAVLISLAVFAFPVTADIDHGWQYVVGGDTLSTAFTYADCSEGTRSLRVEITPLIGFGIIGTKPLAEESPDSVLIDLKPSRDCEFFSKIITTQDTVVTAPISVWGGVWNKDLKFSTATSGSLVKVYLILQNYSTADSLVCLFDNIWFFRNGKWELWDGCPDGESLGVEETLPKISNNRVYPSPFSSVTTIKYSVTKSSHVTLEVYDIVGNLVKTLVNERKPTGFYVVSWNGKNDKGAKLANGVYFYRLQAGDYTVTKKMLLVK